MAFGGTAKTYATWELVGEPFKENGREYVFVIKPGTSTQKKVRWYSDKAHASQKPQELLCKLFGFENEEDYVLCIRKLDLTEQEERDYFSFNWRRGGSWAGSAFFGGAWIAPKTANIPPIRNKDKVFRVYWPDLKKEGQKNAKELGICGSSSPWFA